MTFNGVMAVILCYFTEFCRRRDSTRATTARSVSVACAIYSRTHGHIAAISLYTQNSCSLHRAWLRNAMSVNLRCKQVRYQLSLTNPHNMLHHGKRAANKDEW